MSLRKGCRVKWYEARGSNPASPACRAEPVSRRGASHGTGRWALLCGSMPEKVPLDLVAHAIEVEPAARQETVTVGHLHGSNERKCLVAAHLAPMTTACSPHTVGATPEESSAGAEGIEPPFTESKSVVLPLNDTPIRHGHSSTSRCEGILNPCRRPYEERVQPLVTAVAVCGSRTRCLRLMGPLWKPFHPTAAPSPRIELGFQVP
jgi:hypothetical protein